jgi:hypothetical protein
MAVVCLNLKGDKRIETRSIYEVMKMWFLQKVVCYRLEIKIGAGVCSLIQITLYITLHVYREVFSYALLSSFLNLLKSSNESLEFLYFH